MKRLIRKSEFYKDLTDEEFTYFSYKNPISKEWNDLNKVYKGEKEIELKKYIRGIALENGDVYIIHADKIHEDMAKLLNIPDGLHFEGTNRYEMIIRLTPARMNSCTCEL